MSLTTDDNVRFGLVYVEDIYQMFEKYGRFELKESDRCRKAVCKRIPEETEYYRGLFIRRADSELIDPCKLFDVLAEAFRHAHYRSHGIANLLAAVKKD